MVLYLIKSTSCLALFYVFYIILLEKESVHKLKRYYLLFSLIISFLIPLVSFTSYEYITPINHSNISETSLTVTDFPEKEVFQADRYILLTYLVVASIFLIVFLRNLRQILFKIKHNEIDVSRLCKKVMVTEQVIPHTFFNYIFLNKSAYQTNSIPESVLLHEEAHASQKHSLDVICVEILQILFWFNPLLYLYKKAIKLNHEFLADKAVLNSGLNTKTYQEILLAFSSNACLQNSVHSELANAINYSLIKKRLTIMKTKNHKVRYLGA